jgi:hypothetical protein
MVYIILNQPTCAKISKEKYVFMLQASLLTASRMLLHAFPSMFVSLLQTTS